MYTISLQCALTMVEEVCPACLRLCWDVGWGCRGEGKTEVITRQSDRYNRMLEFSCIFWKEKKTFLLTMSLFQNLFEIYIITASERTCLCWHWSGVGVVFDTLCSEFVWFFFFFFSRLDIHIGKCQVGIKDCPISKVRSFNNTQAMKSHCRSLEAIRKHVIAQSRNQCCNTPEHPYRILQQTCKTDSVFTFELQMF